MGYFGYGRKEVYARKPKKVFRAYKQEFGDEYYPLDEDYTPPEEYKSPLEEYDRKHGQQEAMDTFRVLFIGLIIVIVFVLNLIAAISYFW